MANLIGNEVANTVKHSQVYLATHGGDGNRLPYMNRSFISFTYGGVPIEDFDLIATTTGDRLNRPGYASFNDTVTTYDNLDGQHYWATHYRTNQIDFVLSTDGIDQKKLDDFLHWFKAGTSRELILAEHPNRAIMARVAEPPTINLLPFEQDVTITISSVDYKTKTTLYKGDIQLSLIMDQPHWYALVNILGKPITRNNTVTYEDVWDDPFTGQNDISIFTSKDALKILYEDGIPLGSMIDANMLLGNGAYANVENQLEGCIWDPDGILGNARISGTITGSENPASAYPAGTYVGIIAGAIVDATEQGITSLSQGSTGYFFYAGTAPAPTTIIFTLQPTISGSYVNVPKNSYTNPAAPYNTFTIESENAQTLRFTTPNLYSSFNQAIKVFDTYVNSSYTWEQVRKAIRDQVHHPAIRAWAIKCVEFCAGNNLSGGANSGQRNNLKTYLSYVLKNTDGSIPTATFTFNSETGEAIGYLKYRTISTNASLPADASDWASFGTLLSTPVEEDVGDMLKSNYIIIQDRNYPTAQGKIAAWTNTAEGHKYSHRIQHDVAGGLTNIQILYKNMYL